MMLRAIFIVLIFLVHQNYSEAQRYNFKSYNVEQGLVHSQVLSISQDKKGFMWIATQGGGVSKFDGNNFISYTVYEGLPSNHVFKIYSDSKGNIWAGTTEGLAVFKNNRFERVKTEFGLRDDEIWDIVEDKNGNIFFGTKNYGVVVFDGVKYRNYAINDGLGFSSVNRLYVDSKGILWIASHGYGLAKFNGVKFENVTNRNKLPGLIISEIFNDINGKLIICTEVGMFKLVGEVFLPYEKEFMTTHINSVKIDENKTTWYSNSGSGLIAEDSTGHCFYYHEGNGLPSNYLFSLFIGSSNKLWVATDGAGFASYEGERFIHFNKSNILRNNIVKSIAKAHDGSYLFATEEGITRYYYDTQKTYHYTKENGLIEENVNCIDVAPSGIIWAGTESGILRIDPELGKENFRFFPLDATTLSIYVESENKIWAGTDAGILICNGNEIYKRFKDSIPTSRVYRIKEGKDKILFCTDISLSMYDGKNLSNYKIADAKGSKEIIDVWELNNGSYWLATNRGLTFMDRNFEKVHYTRSEGLGSDNFYMVYFFKNSLWAGGDHGLDKIKLNENMEITQIKHFDKEDGFIGTQCNASAFFMETNRVWIGTIKGVSVYQPEFDFPNKKKPKIHLLNIKLNYQTVDWKKIFPNTSVKDNIPFNLALPYDKNNLLFEFIAIDFVNPEKLKYQFQLEGFNSDWLPLTKQTNVSYTNLPPGEYTFKVKAVNSDGVWSDVYQYSFTIDVPFWKSTLFYFILFPSIIIVIYLIITFRTRQLNRSKRKLEETVRLRTLEINKQKSELEKLSIVADKMNDGVIICQPDGKIDWINDGFKRMTGYSYDEFLNSEIGSKKFLQELSSHKEIDLIVKGFLTKKEPVVYDSNHLTKDGNVMWTRAALTPIYNAKNELLKIVALYSDITDHIRYEETLSQANKDLTDSIVYAKKIQEAILPERTLMDNSFNDYFIFYNPRDIVSGDFYWYSKINGILILAIADCTGHGVPGAFMSMIGNEFLHQIINNSANTNPDLILKKLNQRITQALHQAGGDNDSRDGMDIAICSINLSNLFCRFAGAHIPMFLIRDGELLEFEASKESIGGRNDSEKDFLMNELTLQKGDCIYFTTDGYVDQFGGNDGKKLMKKRWKELIKRYAHLSMKDQYSMLYELHCDWRGNQKQTDDILIIGIRIT